MMTKRNIISFFSRHSDFFIGILSSKYPFTKIQLDKYKNILNWSKVSGNSNIIWTFDIMNDFKNSIEWSALTTNKNAFNDRTLLETFSNKIDWLGEEDVWFDSIASNAGLTWNIEFIEKHESKIDFEKLSANTKVLWSEELIDKFYNRWSFVELGCNESFPWTVYLYEKYLDKSYFSYNPIRWNKAIISNLDFIEKYKSNLAWSDICGNSNLPWIENNLLEYWSTSIDWWGISQNELLFINDKNFFYKNLDKWEVDNFKNFKPLSRNKSLPWSISFIETYKKHWNWEMLSRNEGLPWSIDLIDSFSDYFIWGGIMPDVLFNANGYVIAQEGGWRVDPGLIDNESLPWSIEFLQYYEEKLEFKSLEYNNSVWENAFKPFVNDELIESVLRLI